MSEDADLIKRLRGLAEDDLSIAEEAADRIEDLEADLKHYALAERNNHVLCVAYGQAMNKIFDHASIPSKVLKEIQELLDGAATDPDSFVEKHLNA